MSKMTIIEGNSNDKDNVRGYMVKGEPGVSPTVGVSKEDGVTTLTIEDAEGTHTATIADGDDLVGGVPTDGIIGFDGEAADIPDGYEISEKVFDFTKYVDTENTNLDDYTEEGWYFFDPPYTPTNIPIGVNGFLEVRNSGVFVKQFWYRAGTPGTNDFQTFVRTKSENNAWGEWQKYVIEKDLNIYGVAPYGKNTVVNSYYVDNVNGNDSNLGTQTNPFKTIDPILDKINKGFLKIDIFLKRGQTHLLKGTTFSACTIHLNVFGDGNDNATITTNHGTSAQSLVFYNCHGNFTNITFTNIGVDMYFDGGSLSATNCIFDCKFSTWGAGCRFDNCTIKTLKTRMANIWTYGDNNIIGCVDSYASTHVWHKAKLTPSYAINHDDTNACYVIIGGSLLIFGSTSIVTNDAAAYNRLLIFNGLTFCLSAGPATTTTGTHFSQQSEISCCKVISTSARLSTFSTSADGISYTNGTEHP